MGGKEVAMKKVVLGLVLVAVALFGAVAVGSSLKFLGSYEIPTDEWFYGTMQVGGISGLAYDAQRDVYYGICDDRGGTGTPGRLYTLRIDVNRTGIHNVQVLGVTFLDSDPNTPGVQPYPAKGIDAEEVRLTPEGQLIISSERDLDGNPWIRRFALDEVLLEEIPLPDKFIPGETKGVRSNLAFEGMGLTPDGKTLYAVNEQALVQDGDNSTVEHGTPVRIVDFDLSGEAPADVAEYVYVTTKIFAAPTSGTYADNGVSGMLYIKPYMPEYDLLVMERSYSSGVGNDIKLFGVNLTGATDVKDVFALPSPFTGTPVQKTLLVRVSALKELSDIAVNPDNMEAIAIGPQLANGHYTLIVASDNNFNKHERNLFLAFEIVP